jgi:hypothetical protein
MLSRLRRKVSKSAPRFARTGKCQDGQGDACKRVIHPSCRHDLPPTIILRAEVNNNEYRLRFLLLMTPSLELAALAAVGRERSQRGERR